MNIEIKMISSRLISLNFDYDKIKDKEENISLSINATIQAPENKKNVRRIVFNTKFNIQSTNEECLSFKYEIVYDCQPKDVSISDDKINSYIMKNGYPKVKDFLSKFYQDSHINFIDLPDIEEFNN